MSRFGGIEKLLGIPVGSTELAEKELRPIANKIKEVSTELEEVSKDIKVKEGMCGGDLVKYGLTRESIERDKQNLREDAFNTLEIAKNLLDKLNNQMENETLPNDRMWTSAAKFIDTVTGSIEKLNNMISRHRQEQQMEEAIAPELTQEDTGDKRPLTPAELADFIEELKSRGATGASPDQDDDD